LLQLLASPSAGAGAGGMTLGNNAGRTVLAFNGPADQTPLAGTSERGPLSVWGTAFGGWGQTFGDFGSGSHDITARNAGMALGAEYHLAEWDATVGTAFSFGDTNWLLENNLGAGHANFQMFGLYGSKRFGSFYTSGALAFAQLETNAARTVSFSGTNVYGARFHAQDMGLRIEFGRRFVDDDGLGITPYAAIQAQTFRTPAYQEITLTGLPQLALGYLQQTTDDVTHELGVQLNSTASLDDGNEIELRVRLGWVHNYSGALSTVASFQSFADTAFTVSGVQPLKDAARVSLAVASVLSNSLSLSARVSSDLSQSGQSYTGNATLAWCW
jgi:outer membrane autotransporter protein